mmetsp:Transcript_29208/g.86473  ORF Transcript_29208/g.86473 Transcript_29208/m.86473 type:complete len:308 (+) Transcript_29208:431-1354(+)
MEELDYWRMDDLPRRKVLHCMAFDECVESQTWRIRWICFSFISSFPSVSRFAGASSQAIIRSVPPRPIPDRALHTVFKFAARPENNGGYPGARHASSSLVRFAGGAPRRRKERSWSAQLRRGRGLHFLPAKGGGGGEERRSDGGVLWGICPPRHSPLEQNLRGVPAAPPPAAWGPASPLLLHLLRSRGRLLRLDRGSASRPPPGGGRGGGARKTGACPEGSGTEGRGVGSADGADAGSRPIGQVPRVRRRQGHRGGQLGARLGDGLASPKRARGGREGEPQSHRLTDQEAGSGQRQHGVVPPGRAES